MRQKWFERNFAFDIDPVAFPLIVERLRGTPARLEERIANLATDQLTIKVDGVWSIQENAGHLADIEPLWSGRLDDLLSGAQTLRPADLTNAATHNANHNAKPVHQIPELFRRRRATFVFRLDELTDKQVEVSALHPRLRQPMRTLDLAYFVAEHDDHHLARITELLS